MLTHLGNVTAPSLLGVWSPTSIGRLCLARPAALPGWSTREGMVSILGPRAARGGEDSERSPTRACSGDSSPHTQAPNSAAPGSLDAAWRKGVSISCKGVGGGSSPVAVPGVDFSDAAPRHRQPCWEAPDSPQDSSGQGGCGVSKENGAHGKHPGQAEKGRSRLESQHCSSHPINLWKNLQILSPPNKQSVPLPLFGSSLKLVQKMHHWRWCGNTPLVDYG